MDFDIKQYSGEILEFLSEYTLRDIDYGVLDLTGIKDYNLRAIFYYLSDLLYLELYIKTIVSYMMSMEILSMRIHF